MRMRNDVLRGHIILSIVITMILLLGNFTVYSPTTEINENDEDIEEMNTLPADRGTRSIESYDWPMFQRDVGHTGSADPSLSAPDTNDTAWTFPTAYDIDASAAIVGDMVYFANKYGNVDEDCMIYGVNETTGIYWNFTDGDYDGRNSFRSAPAIVDIPSFGHMLFVGSIGMGATPDFAYGLDATPDDNNDGIIDGLDNDEGLADPPDSNYDLIWRSKLADYTSSSSPLVEYVASLGTHVMYVVGGETLHALNAENGEYIWNFTTGGYIGSSPAFGYNTLGNPIVYIGSDDGILYALDARGAGGTTTIEWQYNVGGWIDSSPTIADDRIFIGSWSNDVLICLDATPDDNGDTLISEFEDEGINDIPGAQFDLIWEYNVGDSITSTPAVHNQRVFITAYDGNIYAFDENVSEPSTSIIWSYYTGGGLGGSSCAVADGKVFVGSRSTNKVIAVDELGGGGTTTLLWDYETNDAIYASPAVANGKVYIGSSDGTFYVFGTGGSINKKPYPPELYSPSNTAILTSSTPKFDWSEAVDVDGFVMSYVIEIDDDSDFSSPEYFEVNMTLTHYFPAFIADGTYYWHVRAIDDMDAYSIWSEAWMVTVDTINDAPQVTVLSPNGGEVWAGAHNIWWNAYDPEAEPVSFDIWLSDDSGANYDILLGANIASLVREWRLETTDYPDGTTYRVKVNATDERGLKSTDTSDSDFTIDNANGVIIDDWPQFHRNENNTGYSPSQAPETNNTDWIFDIGREIDSSPSVFADLVFVGDHNGSFWALDEDTGELVWRYDHTDVWSWCDTSPAIGYSSTLSTYVAFFGLTITDGYNFFAMDVDGQADGDQGIDDATLPSNVDINADVLWAYKAEGSGALSASPTVFNEIVYIGFFETDIGDDNASLYAFDVNGNFNGDDGITDDIVNPDFRSEDILWTFNTNSMAVTTTPAVENTITWGDVVFIGTDEGYWSSEEFNNNFFALDADPFDDAVDQGVIDPPGSTYDLLWEVNLEDYIFSSPAVAYDNVYITTYSSELYNPGNGGMLYCLDTADGNPEWSYEIAPEDDFYASPAVWNDMVYIPSRTNDQRVYAFDATPEDGLDEGYDDPIASPYDIIWIHDIYSSKISSSPAVANGRVYVGAGWEYSWGEMYCLDAIGNGIGGTTEIWVYGTHDFVYGSPSIANGHMYATDTDGYVYRFGALMGTDLTIKHEDISFTPETPQENNTAITISAKVTNLGNLDAFDVTVRIFDDLNDNGIMDSGELIIDTVINSILGYDEATLFVGWDAQLVGYHNLYFIVDPLDTIDELKEDNNRAWSFFAVEDVYSAEIDYIVIRDAPNGGGSWVGDWVYLQGYIDNFYCAGYNNTVGYVQDVSAEWVSNDTNIATVTTPGSGTTFTTSITNVGYVSVTATYNTLTNTTGILAVISPGLDYIIIRDAPNGAGSWVDGKIYGIGASDTFYCAGYNNTAGFVGDADSDWMSNDTGIATVTTPGPGTTFTASTTNWGVFKITATYYSLVNVTGTIIILPPAPDSIMIRSQPGNGGEFNLWIHRRRKCGLDK
jgi:outer membrane protein assembly factor BamB